MTGIERFIAEEYPILFGESLRYSGPQDISVGSVQYVESDGFVGGRFVLDRIDEYEFIHIGNANVIGTWDIQTGKLATLTAHPFTKIYPFGLPILVVSFENPNPTVSVQMQSNDLEFKELPDGLRYDGVPETEAIMVAQKRVSISPTYQVTSPVDMWLEGEEYDRRIVIDSGKRGMVQVNPDIQIFRVNVSALIRLLDSPIPSSQEWRISVADEVKKLRYHVIQNYNNYSPWESG